MIHLLNYVKNSWYNWQHYNKNNKNYNKNNYTVIRIPGIIRIIGSTIAVKSGQMVGNADTFIPIFSADTLGFVQQYN